MSLGASGRPPVVFVHGALDRGASFARVAFLLHDQLDVIRFDRRGYGRRGGPPVPFDAHVDDLLEHLVDADARIAVGHSFGSYVALGAAARDPRGVAAVGCFEPPSPWWPTDEEGRPKQLDPTRIVESFVRHVAGERAWRELPGSVRARRQREGAALLADLEALRQLPLDLTAVRCPVVLATGVERDPRVRIAADELASCLPTVERFAIDSTSHLAHLVDPAAFAAFVLRVVAAASSASGDDHGHRNAVGV